MIRQPIIVVMGHVDHGKCVSGDTLLELSDGRLLKAESAFEMFRYGEPISQPEGDAYSARGMRLLSADDEGNVVSKRVGYVWKLAANRLVCISTRAGYEIKTTPEHKFLSITKDGEIEYVEASKLKASDTLLIPAKTTTSPLSLIGIKKQIFLRISDAFLLRPSDELNGRIVAFCQKGGVRKTGRDVGDAHLSFHMHKGYYRASVLRKIVSKLSYSEDEVYDLIQSIKFSTSKQRASHKSFWLNIPHNSAEFEALYYVLGLLYGDGLRESANLSNTSNVIIDEFRKRIMESFGIGATVSWQRTSFIVRHKGGKTFAKFLSTLFAYPEVDKTRILEVPDLVSAASDDLVRKFIQGFFDAEGYVQAANNMKNVGIGCESPILMRQLPLLLHRFGCFAHFIKRKDKRPEICISGSSNLHAFYRSIGFTEPSKSEQLKKNLADTVSSRVFESTPLNGGFVTKLRQKYGVTGKRGFDLNYYETKQRLTYHSLSRLLQLSRETRALPLTAILSKYKMVQVTELTVLEGDFPVYDFTVDDTHNFIANGLIVHNTALLDSVRSSAVASREAGGITQHIGASEVPLSVIEDVAGPVLKQFGAKIAIPGLLFIDTPGHEAFTNLRKRGGAVADLAILVVDISKGFEPQTYEAIEILKEYKTPFVLAANKIDLITGWRPQKTSSFVESLSKQEKNVQDALEAKLYELVGKLSEAGFSSERFDRITDFRKEVAILPVSAKTKEGIAELLVFTAGIAQKFLEARLNIEVKGPGRGSLLEKKEEKGLGTTIDVILYNGTLKVNDTIAFGTPAGVAKAKIRALLKPRPLQEMRESSSKFYSVESVSAASGVKISGVGFDEALPGSLVISTDDSSYEKEIATEMKDVFATEQSGIVLKADTIGSLEALSRLLANEGVKISKKGIGNVSKRDVLDAFAMRAIDPYSSVVLAFNVSADTDAQSESEAANVKIINENIIYKIIDDYKEWFDGQKKRERDDATKSITFPCIVKILPNTAFRISHPAIFGVDVAAGRLKSSVLLMNKQGEVVGRVREMQNNGMAVDEAKKGDSVAISIDGITFGRQVKDNDVLYSHINDEEEQLLRSKFGYLLSDEEKELLNEISALKRGGG